MADNGQTASLLESICGGICQHRAATHAYFTGIEGQDDAQSVGSRARCGLGASLADMVLPSGNSPQQIAEARNIQNLLKQKNVRRKRGEDHFDQRLIQRRARIHGGDGRGEPEKVEGGYVDHSIAGLAFCGSHGVGYFAESTTLLVPAPPAICENDEPQPIQGNLPRKVAKIFQQLLLGQSSSSGPNNY